MYNVERANIKHKNISTLEYGVTYKFGIKVRLTIINQIIEQDSTQEGTRKPL